MLCAGSMTAVGSEGERRYTTQPDHSHQSSHITHRSLHTHARSIHHTKHSIFPALLTLQTTTVSFIRVLLDLLGYKKNMNINQKLKRRRHSSRITSSRRPVFGVMHCVSEKGLLFVDNLLVCGQAGTRPCPMKT